MKKLIAILAALFTSNLYAVEARVEITCKSGSGKTKLAVVYDEYSENAEATLEIKRPSESTYASLSFDNSGTVGDTKATLEHFDKLSDHVWTLSGKKRVGMDAPTWIRVWMLPFTLDEVPSEPFTRKFRFEAKVSGTHPVTLDNIYFPEYDQDYIYINCTSLYKY